ncbi:MAG: hypothetical protein K2W95_31635 [Candidatus Obscuribacterales bacterium]|nr:hypothetical protein [Candidatus Obscuribacterales bacterium]
MRPRKAVVVFNPKGGSARTRAATLLADAFAGIGASVAVKATTAEPGSACALAREAIGEGADFVVAMGGDGTACQVAEALMGTDIPMGIFPGGTGNLFARSFYAVPSAEEFVNMIASGKPQPIDMIKLSYADLDGRAHERYFMVAVGVGKLSDAVSRTSATFKRWFGKLAYVVNVGLSCLRLDAPTYRLSFRGSSVGAKAASVIVLNVLPAHLAMMSRGCNASDGLMDVGIIGCTNLWQLIKLGFWTLLGRPERSRCYRTIRAAEMVVECDRPVNPNIDGDPSDQTHKLIMKVVPGAVSMILAG